MNGYRLAQALKAQARSGMRLVMLSGMTLDDTTLRLSRTAGFDDCIDKAQVRRRCMRSCRRRARRAPRLFDRDAFREVARLIDVGAPEYRGVIGEQLQRMVYTTGPARTRRAAASRRR